MKCQHLKIQDSKCTDNLECGVFAECFQGKCTSYYSLPLKTSTAVSGTPSKGYLCETGFAKPVGMGQTC